jgi:hypothetical protein
MFKKYPHFSKLDIQDKNNITSFVNRFEPYSDFNFTSLFCWDDNSTEMSELNGNLVIRMSDYTSDLTVYSILGDSRIDESIEELLKTTKSISFVPEVVANSITDKKRFVIVEDRDQFDYIYPITSQAHLAGGDFKIKRNKISNFMRNNLDNLSVKKINFKNPHTTNQVEEVMTKWATERKRDELEFKREKQAIERLFDYGASFNLTGIQIFLDDKCVAFTINEPVQMNYAICHFQKSILTFEHLDVFLSNLAAKEMKHFGCRFMNWEQDLGIPGLRKLKESYQPEFYLKKYIIEKLY